MYGHVVPPRPDDDEIVGECELPGCGKQITRKEAMQPGASAHYCSWKHAQEMRLSAVHGQLGTGNTESEEA